MRKHFNRKSAFGLKAFSHVASCFIIFAFFATLLPIKNENGLFWQSKYFGLFLCAILGSLIWLTFSLINLKKLETYKVLQNPTILLYTAYFFYLLLTFSIQSQNLFYNKELLTVGLMLISLVTISTLTKDNSNYRILIFGYLLSVVFQNIMAGLQVTGIIENHFSQFGFGGTFGNPNILSSYILPGFLLSLGWVIFRIESNKLVKIILYSTLLSSFLILLLSETRAVWVAGLLGISFMLGRTELMKNRILKLSSFTKAFIILSTIALMAIFSVFAYNLKPESANGRLFIWKITLSGIQNKPFFGHGIGSFNKDYNLYQSEYFNENNNHYDEMLLADNIRTAFNEFLNIAFESGIFGFLLFMLFIISLIRKAFDKNLSKAQIVLYTCILAIIINALFSYTFYIEHLYFIFIFFTGLAISSLDPVHKKIVFRNPLLSKTLLSVCLLIAILMSYLLYKNFNSYLDLIEYRKLHPSAQREERVKGYESLESKLFYDISFIQDASYFYMGCKEYEKTIDLISNSELYHTDSQLAMRKGDAYYKLKLYDKAEEYYILSMNIKPSMFAPRKRLMMLYNKIGEEGKMCAIIDKTLDLPRKVNSRKVDMMVKDIAQLQLRCNLLEGIKYKN